MAYLQSYKRLNRLMQNESFEPMLSWGVRMALAGTVPIIWGLAVGRLDNAVWITLTAEAVSWVEMKGSFAWRVRTLLAGSALALLFALAGQLTAGSMWLSLSAMFAVGFLATLLKNLGDRASGLAICVYLLFIIGNAFPETNPAAITLRLQLIAIGAGWAVFVGLTTSAVMPGQEPFRRQIALIWRSIASLVNSISRSAADTSSRKLTGDVYAKENDVRTAIDNSYEFYSRMAHQVSQKDNQQYQLAMLRKVAGLAAANVISIAGEMEHIDIAGLDETLRIKAATLFSALKEAINRISIFVITLKPEEKLLAGSQINRLKKLVVLIKQYQLPQDETQLRAINRILQLVERTVRLLENALLRVDAMGKDMPVYRSYSFLKTLFLLKPRYLLSSLRVLFNLDTLTTRYALRSAIAVTLALFLSRALHIDHGYWLPFSVMIIIQPYFGATFKKAIERVTGTLLGGLAGSMLLHVPTGLHITEGILFITFVLMVYYVRRNYAVAAFFITLNLVLLFNLEAAYNDELMVTRALLTIGGAMLAIFSGFALLPTWDKKWLPAHLAAAIQSNYSYFSNTFFAPERIVNWTRNKRLAESQNSNVFDSFNRYMDEPGADKSEVYYQIITYNVRITRNLNNIHLEQDEKKTDHATTASPAQQAKIAECLDCFNHVMRLLPILDDHTALPKLLDPFSLPPTPFALNDAQMVSLEKVIIELKTMSEEIAPLRPFKEVDTL